MHVNSMSGTLKFAAPMQKILLHAYSKKGNCTAAYAEPWTHSPAADRESVIVITVLLLSDKPWDGFSLGLCCTHSSSPFDEKSRDFDWEPGAPGF